MKKTKDVINYELLKIKVAEQSVILKNLMENNPMQIIWVPAKRASELYGVTIRTINNWKNEGRILTKKINDKLYVSIAPLLEM